MTVAERRLEVWAADGAEAPVYEGPLPDGVDVVTFTHDLARERRWRGPAFTLVIVVDREPRSWRTVTFDDLPGDPFEADERMVRLAADLFLPRRS